MIIEKILDVQIIIENIKVYYSKGIFKINNDILILFVLVMFVKIIFDKGKYNLRQVNRRNK